MAALTPPARRRAEHTLLSTGLGALAVLWMIPLVVVVLTAIRPETDLIERGTFSLPGGLALDNFAKAWETGNFSTYYRNSILVTLVKVPLSLLLASLAAYSLARLRVRFGTWIFLALLVGLAVPVHVTLLPLVQFMAGLGLLDTPLALIGPYLAFGLPLQIMVLRGFFAALPEGLLEAARLDGASELRIFWRIVVPLSAPILAALFVIDAVTTWNEFLLALVLLNSEALRTVPLGLLNFQGQFSTELTQLNAAILIGTAPVIALFLGLQRYIVRGLTAGALKG